MKTQTSRKTNAPATTSATPIPAPQTHDEAPAPDLAALTPRAAQGHSFAALGVSAARSGAIQPKLTVGAPDDKYEAEADRVAGQVMRMPDPTVQRAETPEDDDELIQTKPAIQRAEMPEEDELVQTKPAIQRVEAPEDEDELVQTKPAIQRAADGSFDAGADVSARIGVRRGGGSPLPESARQFMEPRFGADFSGVRVHADGEADRLSQDLSARAFTTGSDIYFRQGEFSPSSSGGQELLAHELTHVVQQRSGFASSFVNVGWLDSLSGPSSFTRNAQKTGLRAMQRSGGLSPTSRVIQRVKIEEPSANDNIKPDLQIRTFDSTRDRIEESDDQSRDDESGDDDARYLYDAFAAALLLTMVGWETFRSRAGKEPLGRGAAMAKHISKLFELMPVVSENADKLRRIYRRPYLEGSVTGMHFMPMPVDDVYATWGKIINTLYQVSFVMLAGIYDLKEYEERVNSYATRSGTTQLGESSHDSLNELVRIRNSFITGFGTGTFISSTLISQFPALSSPLFFLQIPWDAYHILNSIAVESTKARSFAKMNLRRLITYQQRAAIIFGKRQLNFFPALKLYLRR